MPVNFYDSVPCGVCGCGVKGGHFRRCPHSMSHTFDPIETPFLAAAKRQLADANKAANIGANKNGYVEDVEKYGAMMSARVKASEDRIGDYKTRKQRPLCTGVLDYFPDALLDVAHCSWVGNEQHNPGEKLHWAKEKSIGEGNEILRHLIDRGKRDTDGVRHLAKAAWRCLELLQREIEAERKDAT